MATPYATVVLATVGSTQDEARVRYSSGESPVLVVAAHQTSGRGRTGREWVHAPRALAASLAFRPGWPGTTWPRITLVAGLAAAEAVEELTAVGLGLKWPNDLVHPADGAKVGGILSESAVGAVVTGLGINLHWPDPPPDIGALLPDDPGPDLAPALAAAWADRVLAALDGAPEDWGIDEYRRRSVTAGAAVTWEPGGAGQAVGIDVDGRLVVETGAGPVRLAAGEVRHVRGPDRAT